MIIGPGTQNNPAFQPVIAAEGNKVAVAWMTCNAVVARVSNDKGQTWGPIRTLVEHAACDGDFIAAPNSIAIRGNRIAVEYTSFGIFGDGEENLIRTTNDFASFSDDEISSVRPSSGLRWLPERQRPREACRGFPGQRQGASSAARTEVNRSLGVGAVGAFGAEQFRLGRGAFACCSWAGLIGRLLLGRLGFASRMSTRIGTSLRNRTATAAISAPPMPIQNVEATASEKASWIPATICGMKWLDERLELFRDLGQDPGCPGRPCRSGRGVPPPCCAAWNWSMTCCGHSLRSQLNRDLLDQLAGEDGAGNGQADRPADLLEERQAASTRCRPPAATRRSGRSG